MLCVSCSICREFISAEDSMLYLHCGHIFHQSCLSRWIEERNTCPHCRTSITTQPSRVYLNFEENDSDDITIHSLRTTVTHLEKLVELVTFQQEMLSYLHEDKENENYNLKSRITDLEEELMYAELDSKTDKYFKTLFIHEKDNAIVKLRDAQHEVCELKKKLKLQTLIIKEHVPT